MPWLESEFKFDKVEEDDVLSLLKPMDVKKAWMVLVVNFSKRQPQQSAVVWQCCLTSVSGVVGFLGSGRLQRVTPILKGGDVELVNYRPVSVLPIVVKIMEKIVHQQLYAYLQDHSILSSAQSGFRPQHTTQDVLMSSVDDWMMRTSWWGQ